MTLSEFKAWFEGFSEGIDKAPTEKQFAKIKAKVAEIDGAPVTQTIFVDRYVRALPGYWERPYMTWDGVIGAGSIGGNGVGTGSAGGGMMYNAASFDSHADMRLLGKVEAMH